MRLRLTLDDALVEKAKALTGLDDISAIVTHALRELIAREASIRLAGLGGSAPSIEDIPRRRSEPEKDYRPPSLSRSTSW